ncbi:LCP family protein [Amnibacterium kyonggiense]|uniref:LytR family transcriptional attenuator n=1 Tax=Amnibacterium kyonggiense TaxID=595671 RepID=A0A4R7FIR6_9MICO|nr:LCP family protein [Amnibacterium kyonggiense]TDS74988.1 LytR family transcriptional attenuator [Amnibacterium kyonggiense]
MRSAEGLTRPVPDGAVLRDPAAGDARLMTRRAGWLTALHLLIPGSAQTLAGSRRIGRVALGLWLLGWAVLLVAVVLWFLLPQVLLSIPTNAVGLTLLQLAVVAWGIGWALLTLDTVRLLRLHRVAPVGRAVLGGLLAVALVIGVGGAGWGAWAAGVARSTIGSTFASTRMAAPADGRYNILLLGGDAGPGRSGLRPDSISVVSLNALTGDMVSFGLPRDTNHIPFSDGSPMRRLYPDGYGTGGRCNVDVCQLNSIYTEAQLKEQKLYPDAVKDHSSAGIEATREAVEGALGIPIQYYVLVDMTSFEPLIDAMGGVTVTVKERLPVGGHIVNGKLTGVKVWIEKGTRHLDGNKALWFARSRYGSRLGDYDRMARQRQLEEAMLHQMNPLTLLTRFDKIAKSGSNAVQTDLPQGLLGVIAGAAVQSRSQKTKDVEFVKPHYDPAEPDWSRIHRVVQETLH